MPQKTNISFIGGGQMARAIIAGLPKDSYNITASSPNPDKLQALKNDFAIAITADNYQAAQSADVLVLSVKPQKFLEATKGLVNALKPNTLIVSVMAGISITGILEAFPGHPVVRSMPNTPALIGRGITGVYAQALSSEHKSITEQLLESVGEMIWLDTEEELHIVTALSGSGPAYLFYWIEAMIAAGVNAGLSKEKAEVLVTKTMCGASMLAESSALSVTELKNNVTSKGGTTEAALNSMMKNKLGDLIQEAVRDAQNRSKALAKL